MANNGVMHIILIVAVAFFGLYLLQTFSGKRNYLPTMVPMSGSGMPAGGGLSENFSENGGSCSYTPNMTQMSQDAPYGGAPPTCPTNNVSQCDQDMMYQDPAYQQMRQASCFPRSQLSPEELLPQDNCSLWAQVNPQGSGSLKDRNFLQAGWATGVSTVGSTLRNANRQLRSEPPNPQVKVSPWMQTTVEPDVSRKPFEIGGCA